MTLRRIRIQGLGVIDDAELDLVDGLNVITGETGAGKTMVVSGLGLLLGARADAGLVRSGEGRAVVEGEVDVPAAHPAAERVEEAGGDTEGGLILVRTVAAEGRSRASVGGRSAPVSVLAEVGEHLVAVHGQADQWRLRDADQHRILLDVAGGDQVARARADYEIAWRAWQEERSRLVELTRSAAERSVRVSVLRAALDEIDAVAPLEGEEEELRAESDRLTHAEELRSGAQGAHDALVGVETEDGPSVTTLVAGALSALAPAAGHDPQLAALRTRVEEIGYLTADLASDLASYGAGVEVDPARLDAVHERRAALGGLLRRYGPGTAEVLAFAEQARAELARIDLPEDAVRALAEQVEGLRVAAGRAGWALGEARREVAARVGTQVTQELAHLAMGSATVTVDVRPRLAPAPGPATAATTAAGPAAGATTAAGPAACATTAAGPATPGEVGGPAEPPRTIPLPSGEEVLPAQHGVDLVEIQLAANPGAPARSVTRAASGGELSRVMLALELVCGDGSVPTYVFDEVDAGVGGAAALDLGARLARLAEHSQVIVVTHLGQVAAHADRHLVVRKSTDGQVTRSGVVVVDGAEREAELARMLGGVADSDAALEHARELLARRTPRGGG